MKDENEEKGGREKERPPVPIGSDFYRCPRCGGDHVTPCFFDEKGEILCLDCWRTQNGDRNHP